MGPKFTFGCLFPELMQKSGWDSFAKDFSLENLKSFAASQRLSPQASKSFHFITNLLDKYYIRTAMVTKNMLGSDVIKKAAKLTFTVDQGVIFFCF
jgi:hypothetical protein